VRTDIESPEQVCEELPQQDAGAFAVLELGGAKTEYFVSAELKVPVTAHVGRIGGTVRSSVSPGEVMRSVDLNNYPLAVGQ